MQNQNTRIQNFSELSIGSWNIHGLFRNINGFRYNKLHEPKVDSYITSHHIVGLSETHHLASDIDSLYVRDYICFNNPSRKVHKRGRPSGGMSIYIKKELRPGILKVPSRGPNIVCLHLKKTFFCFKKDVYLLFTYCTPYNSKVLDSTNEDVYNTLEDMMTDLKSRGDVDIFVYGDLNSRTRESPDFLPDEDNRHIPVPPQGIYDTDSTSWQRRNNLDTEQNSYGKKLLELCRSLPLRVVNGRVIGDLLGNFTCFTGRGKSSVDYLLATPGIFSSIKSFSVKQLYPTISDHTPLTFQLEARYNVVTDASPDELYIVPERIIWDKAKQHRYEICLQTDKSKEALKKLLEAGSDENIENLTSILSSTIVNAAKEAEMTVTKPKLKNPTKKPKPKQPKWYEESCHTAFLKVQKTAKLLQSYPNNSWLRGKLSTETKQYNKIVKKQQSDFVKGIFKQLDEFKDANPHDYFNLIKSLKSGSFDKNPPSDTDCIKPQEWLHHFKSLLGKEVQSNPEIEHLSRFIQENSSTINTILDDPFSIAEIRDGSKGLKNNKASAFDSVTNEMIKYGIPVIGPCVKLIFNKILDSQEYPKVWTGDILSPLHKSGPLDDPNNFRGISVASCLGKLFNSLLNKRLEKFTLPLISRSQLSSCAGARTADHTLVLKFLIDKYVKQKKQKLYACFVDLKKAFDTISRVRLFYKLLVNFGVGGKFLGVLQDIYRNNKIHVKIGNGLTEGFQTTTGVKQGDNLSSLCFNLFINDLPGIYDDQCDPVDIGGELCSILLWCDDSLLLSTSPGGLQRAIDLTGQYCSQNDLLINCKKTKIIVFNQTGRTLADQPEHLFSLDGKLLEVTAEYTYLGLKFKPSGSFTAL